MSNDTQPRPTLEELYADLEHANLMRRQATIRDRIIHWRNEVGRLSDAIRRAQMRRRAGKGQP